MPLYEYKCNNCEKTFDVLQRINAEPLTQCRLCQGSDVEKLISVSSFQFKGSGWYITDYKNKSPRTEATEKAKNISTTTEATSTNK